MANIIHVGGGGGGSTPTLITKSITQNGTYLAQDDNADGYSEVTVDVAGGGTPFNTVKLFSGKISSSDGSIVSDSDFYYTDYIDCPNGSVMFDLGRAGALDYDGIVLYKTDGTFVEFFTASQRQRVVNLSTYYSSGARKIRLSFLASNLEKVVLYDYSNALTYSGSEPTWITNNGGTVVQNLKLNEGKIATQTGEIVADSDYYYTDEFDMPSGNMMFDMNLNSNQTYDGLVIYDDSGTYNNYWNPNARFRVVNMASYYHEGYKCRLSFRKSNIDYVMLRDYNANILYTTNTPVIIGDEHYQWGSRGLQLHNILTAGVISNDIDYQTATFEDSIGADDNYLLMRMLKDGSYRYMSLAKSDIPASGEYSFAFSDVQCSISQTTIRATYYQGNWRYIYVDIIGSNDLIFPQAE